MTKRPVIILALILGLAPAPGRSAPPAPSEASGTLRKVRLVYEYPFWRVADITVLDALKKERPEDIRAAVAELLAGKDRSLRMAAAAAVILIKTPDTTDLLIETYSKTRDDSTRLDILKVAGSYPDARLIPIFKMALRIVETPYRLPYPAEGEVVEAKAAQSSLDRYPEEIIIPLLVSVVETLNEPYARMGDFPPPAARYDLWPSGFQGEPPNPDEEKGLRRQVLNALQKRTGMPYGWDAGAWKRYLTGRTADSLQAEEGTVCREIRRILESGQRSSQAEALRALMRFWPLTPKEVGGARRCSDPALSRAIKALAESPGDALVRSWAVYVGGLSGLVSRKTLDSILASPDEPMSCDPRSKQQGRLKIVAFDVLVRAFWPESLPSLLSFLAEQHKDRLYGGLTAHYEYLQNFSTAMKDVADDKALGPLLRAFGDKQCMSLEDPPQECICILETMRSLNRPSMLDFSRQVFKTATSPKLRLPVLAVLSESKDNAAIPLFMEALGSPSPGLRRDAAWALRNVRAAGATKTLTRLAVQDPRYDVREAALAAVSDLVTPDDADPEIVDAMLQIIKRKELASEAISVLTRMKAKAGCEPVMGLVGNLSRSATIRSSAANAVEILCSSKDIPALRTRLALEPNQAVRRALERSIAALQSKP